MFCYVYYTTELRTTIMLVDKNRIKDICEYIDHAVLEDRSVCAIQLEALKKEIEKSIRKNNVITSEIEFILKRL